MAESSFLRDAHTPALRRRMPPDADPDHPTADERRRRRTVAGDLPRRSRDAIRTSCDAPATIAAKVAKPSRASPVDTGNPMQRSTRSASAMPRVTVERTRHHAPRRARDGIHARRSLRERPRSGATRRRCSMRNTGAGANSAGNGARRPGDLRGDRGSARGGNAARQVQRPRRNRRGARAQCSSFSISSA